MRKNVILAMVMILFCFTCCKKENKNDMESSVRDEIVNEQQVETSEPIENQKIEQQTEVSYIYDSILYQFMIDLPFILVDTSKTVRIESISYKNIATGEIYYGDDVEGIRRFYEYSFHEGRVTRQGFITILNGIERVPQETDLNYSENGLTVIDKESQSIVKQTEFVLNDNNLIISGGSDGSTIGAVFINEENKISCYSSLEEYNLNPDKPDTVIEKLEDGNVAISDYYFHGPLYKTLIFIDGILMKEEYADGVVREYSTTMGTGEVIKKDKNGTVLETYKIERRLDDNGYLIYEKESYDNGEGHEYIVTYK